ncbi:MULTISPECIES: hypothetical protein [Microcoleaceae]|uniref:hypothetical protein n=1 Tax=Microcoleaceae TaxID=1892252 RepID=UPI00187DE34F|nr:hypothetical protein [Tychonema sp. LEGE 06208]MBE9164635.1 hypothetical protein [Tychonema sp. LEGE 06208]
MAVGCWQLVVGSWQESSWQLTGKQLAVDRKAVGSWLLDETEETGFFAEIQGLKRISG